MREAILLVIGYVLLVLQSSLCPAVAVAGAQPDLLAAAAVFVALYATGQYAFLVGTGLGLARDLTATGPLGPYTLVFTLATYLLGRLRQDVYKENVLTVMCVVLLASFAVNWIAVATSLVCDGRGAGPWGLALTSLGVGVYTAAVSPPLFWLLRRLRRLLGMVESYRIG